MQKGFKNIENESDLLAALRPKNNFLFVRKDKYKLGSIEHLMDYYAFVADNEHFDGRDIPIIESYMNNFINFARKLHIEECDWCIDGIECPILEEF